MRYERGKEYIPPGYRRLSEVGDEIGRQELRDQLALGHRSAFRVEASGLIVAIPKEDWITPLGDAMIATGYAAWPSAYEEKPEGKALHPHVHAELLLLREGSATPGSFQVASSSSYVPPFIELMLEAVREFGIRADEPSPPQKVL